MLPNAENIISLPIEFNRQMADSKFRLIHIASQRVRELSAGKAPLVTSKSIKDTTIALEESLLGRYRVLTGEEAKRAKEERRKLEEREKLEEQISAKEEEIRKELSAYLSESQSETEGVELETAEAGEKEEEPAEEEGAEETEESEYSEE